MWQALFASHALFRENAGYVAEKLGYAYPDYDEKVTAYLKKLFEER
jgi:aminoglycoside 6-adenylyltransferase